MSALSDFFTQLGQDAPLMEDYKQNPEAVMRAHGLTDEEMELGYGMATIAHFNTIPLIAKL